jgi:hypothetical protein
MKHSTYCSIMYEICTKVQNFIFNTNTGYISIYNVRQLTDFDRNNLLTGVTFASGFKYVYDVRLHQRVLVREIENKKIYIYITRL